ncbi:unnamed protein product [Lymnaea stagnalis]|uniref:C1q domain-containing protein n=1 Tax=Lymnaea stagnalis TaxID=6523 RepID=A0AAV2I800_LYMST
MNNKELSKVDTIENQVAEISNKVTQMEMKCCRPNVGFSAWSTFNLAAGCVDLKKIHSVKMKANSGDHFDPLSVTLTAPLNGLYLINISTRCEKDEPFFIACFHKTKKKIK